MKKLKVFLIAVLMATGLSAQNLVTNGNFSVKATVTLCPNSTGFDHGRPNGWWDEETKPLNFLPFAETPDYFHPCAPSGTFNPGANYHGCADPKTGTAYTGLLCWSNHTPDRSAEYMYQELASPLIKNQPYYIEFWVSAADDPQFNYFVKSLGMYLTNNTLDFADAGTVRGYHHLASSVQIPNTFPAANYYTTTNGWQKISGTYTPTVDSVKHILIGNFDPGIAAYDQQTNRNSPNIQHRSGSDSGDQPGDGQTSYYFIDAVYIAPASQGVPNYEHVISGSGTVCTSNQTYILSNYNTLASVTWQASPSSLFATSSGSGSTATLKAKNSSVFGSGTLTFTIQGVCDVVTKQKMVWVGKPSLANASIDGISTVNCQNNTYIYNLEGTLSGSDSFVWETSGHLNDISYATLPEAYIQPTNGGNAFISVKATNACGSSYLCKSVSVATSYPCGPDLISFPGSHPCVPFRRLSMNIYPNPTSDVLTIEMAGIEQSLKKESKISNATSSLKVMLYDFNQQLIHESLMTHDLHKIETKSLKKGFYILKINHGKEEVFQQIIILE